MNRVLVEVGLGLSLVLALGCSSSQAPGVTSASGGSGGAASAGGGAAGRASVAAGGGGGKVAGIGPAISTAPAAWARPADCGGVGDLCPNLFGCEAGKSSCQLEGNVCIPAIPAGATSLPGRSADTPYCAAYTCMTFEQASCFCTGEAGKTERTCESPSALALLCAIQGASCDERPCCMGSCVSLGNAHKQCITTCKSKEDCPDTGCCADPYEQGFNICSPRAACDNPCKKSGDTTCTPGSSTTPTDCCKGGCIQSTVPAFAGCRPSCTKNADCASSCCQPFSDGSYGFCADAAFCSCGELGAECGPNSPECCSGTDCAGNDKGGFECYPACKTAADCSTQCCALFTGEDHGVCLPASKCGQ